MATLEKIRNHAVILVIAIGLALLAFLLGDFLNHGNTLFQDARTNAIVVNGEKVKIHEYQARVDKALEQYRQQYGGGSLNDLQTSQLRNQVYAQIVSEKILDEQTEKLGLTVSPAETFDLVQGDFVSPVLLQSPMFANPETGQYDKVALLNFLKSIDPKQSSQYTPEQQAQMQAYRDMWVTTEATIRDYRLNEKYTQLIAKAVAVNKLEIADALNGATETANLAYVPQKAIELPDTVVKVDDKAIKDFYNQNKELFKTEAGRIVDVIYTTIRPSADDVEAAHKDVLDAEKELREGLNPGEVVAEYSDQEYIDAYMPLNFFRNELFATDLADQLAGAEVGYVSPVTQSNNTYRVAKLVDVKVAPDSLLVRHIVLPPSSQPVAGIANADSLFNIAKANPADFANLATTHSLDKNTATRGGEIGWLTEYAAQHYIDKDFAAKLFAAPVGTPVRIDSRYGHHIVLVEKATAPVRKYLVAYVTKAATPSSQTYTTVYNDMNNFLVSHKNTNGIDTAAIAKGYQVLRDQAVYGMQPAIAPGLTASRELVKWALDSKIGAVSDIKECDDKFAFTVVRKEIEKGYLPVDDAKEQIYPVVLNQAKVDYMYNQLKNANHTSLENFAQTVNQHVDTLKYVQFSSNRIENIGFEPAINAAAAYAPLNKLVPVKGLATVYLVNVFARDKEANLPNQDAVKASLENERANLIRMSALQAIIMKADIEDNRARFY